MPPKNAAVKTDKGPGKVVEVQIMTQLVVVQYEGGNKEAYKVDEIELIDNGRPAPDDRQDNDKDEQKETQQK